MFFTEFVAVSFILACLRVIDASPQLTTTLPIGFTNETGGSNKPQVLGGVYSGVIAGTGPDDTTFALDPDATGDAPATDIIVENASGFSANLEVSDPGFGMTRAFGCSGIVGGVGECTDVLVEVNGSSTISEAVTVTSAVPVVITAIVSTAIQTPNQPAQTSWSSMTKHHNVLASSILMAILVSIAMN